MSKRIIAVIIFALVLCGTSYASDGGAGYFSIDWDSVGEYASDLWDSAADYVYSFFGGESSLDLQSDDVLPKEIASGWDKLTDSLGDALILRDKNDKLPKSSWLPFTEDQESNNKKINALLDRALNILLKGNAGNIRLEVFELKERISRLRNELDETRNKRIHAPEKTYQFWKMTRDKADKRISELEQEIKDSEAKLKQINSKLTSALKDIGLELDSEQIDILLNSVTGDDLLQNAIIFDNVKRVVTKLEELSQNDTNTLEITRRYTGMYLVLNDLLIHTQEELVRKIDGDYTPKLKDIISESDTLRKEALTRSNQNVYTDSQRRSFAVNAESNALTIQVAKLYIELLKSQRLEIMGSIRSLRLNRDLAENTYRTVRSSGELRGLIHSGLSLFDSIGSLSMPELKIFENGAMRREFEELNRRLKRESVTPRLNTGA